MESLTNDYTYLCTAVIHPMPSLATKPSTVKMMPRYMAKRPLLTIKIPNGIEQEPSRQEVSCFSPMTPDAEDSESEATLGTDGGVRADEDGDEDKDEETRQLDERDDDVRPMVPFVASWGGHRRYGSFQANASQTRRISQWHKRCSLASISPASHFSFSPSSHCSRSSSNVGDCTACHRTPNSGQTFHRRRLSLHCFEPSTNAGDCFAFHKSTNHSESFHRRRLLKPFDGTTHRRVPSGSDIIGRHRSPTTFSVPSFHRFSKTLDQHGWRSTTY